MHTDHLRLLTLAKHFPWGEVPSSVVLLIQCLLGVRRRFDYIIRVLSYEDDVLLFQIRDARNSLLPGTAEPFIGEIDYLTSGAWEWMIQDKGGNNEMIAVRLKQLSESVET